MFFAKIDFAYFAIESFSDRLLEVCLNELGGRVFIHKYNGTRIRNKGKQSLLPGK